MRQLPAIESRASVVVFAIWVVVAYAVFITGVFTESILGGTLGVLVWLPVLPLADRFLIPFQERKP